MPEDLSAILKDPVFLKASQQDKIALLSSIDPEFAKVGIKDQADFVQHLVNPDQPVTSAGQGMLNDVNRYAGKALSAAGLPTALNDIYPWMKRMTGQDENAQPFWQPFINAAKNPTQENIVGAVPFFGPSAVSMSKDVQNKDYGGALSTLAGTVAGPLAGAQVKPGLQALKQSTAEGLRTPSGKLTPGTKKLATVTGGAAGGGLGAATGIPGLAYGGGAGGALLGSTIADKIIPNRPTAPNFYGGAYVEPPNPAEVFSQQMDWGAPLGSPKNPGPMSKIPTRMPKAKPEASSTGATTTGGAEPPFEPTIYASPEEAAQGDFRLKNLQRQARAAGTYHAAQGAASRKLNLQQRIGKKFPWEVEP